MISADSQGLLQAWARQSKLTVPNDAYFQGMLKELESTLGKYFSRVDVVPEEFLRKGLNGLVSTSPFPVVSLDRAYVNNKQANLIGLIDATRTVDTNLNNTGLGSRALEMNLERQIGQLAIRQKGKVINMIDDVIFEGRTMLQLVQKLKKKGVTIDTVFSGITIREGQDLLEKNGVQVQSLLVYDQVTDEICERDFVVGAPYSGRSVVNGGGVIEGAPYLYPFGKPVEWASIPPEQAMEFSLFALTQALQLWLKTEKLSRREISPREVAKPVFRLPQSESISQSISQVIQGINKKEI